MSEPCPEQWRESTDSSGSPGYEQVEEAVAAIGHVVDGVPATGLVLGSGLGCLVDALLDTTSIGYDLIPHMPLPTVTGHAGQFVVGTLGQTRLAIFQGRSHAYEGHALDRVTFPIRLLARLGCRRVILTAAVGGIRADLEPGHFVVISDHLNLLGSNPLRGPNDERLGPRFPDMTQVYCPLLRTRALWCAHSLGLPCHEGVYAAMPGPSYETPAEIRMLAGLGADVVGMSTVPEAIVARHAGLAVLGIAVVANRAAGMGPALLDHADVLAAMRRAAADLTSLLATTLDGLDAEA